MDKIKNGWFSEINDLWPGVCLSLEVEKVLYNTKSQFQDITVLQTKKHGRALILDGIIQCTESDEFSYQEMITFLPLCCHPSPSKVLIVGGGDGGVAREVCKYPAVKEAHLVEIDELVIETSKNYLVDMAAGFSCPKLTIHINDGIKFVEEHKSEFDVIITDSSDPIGPAVALFQKEYFKLLKEALRPGGIICSQAGTIWANLDAVVNTYKICKDIFPSTAFAYTSVPTYPTGQIGFILGCLEEHKCFSKPVKTLTEEDLKDLDVNYYTSAVHSASFSLPRFAAKIFN